MRNSQAHRNFWLAAIAASLLTVAGCSNQPEQATNPPVPPRKPAAAAKAAPAKPAAAPAKANASAKPANGKATAKPVAASSKVAPAPKLVTVPKGTLISTTLSQSLASNKSKAGDSFTATLSSSVKVNGKTVLPKGAKLTGHVITAKKKAPAELTVALASVEIQGKSYPLHTNSVGPAVDKAKEGDDSEAKPKKDLTLAAQSHVKFKLAKSVKLPIKG